MMNWVMAVTLICGSSVFTACSNTEDNPAPQNASKRKEFVEHVRTNLKTLAENQKFVIWNSLNHFAIGTNQWILLNDEFDKTISRTFGEKIQESIHPYVKPDRPERPEGEGGEEGRPDRPERPDGKERVDPKYEAIVDLTDFNYTFTATLTGFEVAENDDKGLEIVIPNLKNEESNIDCISISLKGTGDTYEISARRLSNDSVRVTVLFPEQFELAFATLSGGTWTKNLYGTIHNTAEARFDDDPDDGTSHIHPRRDSWNIAMDLHAIIPDVDAADIYFALGQNSETHQAGMAFRYAHNGYKIAEAIATLSNANGRTDLRQITSSSSIMDVVTALMAGNSIEDLQLTFLDCLTTNAKVSDCEEVLKIQNAMAKARRNYADQQTIGEYVNQLNQLVSCTMTDKTLGQEIPMRLVTAKIGVDWWAVPGLNFADENGYIPLTEMLDKESVEYAFNIIDHAVDPMKNSVIVVRQLAQILQKLQNLFYETQPNDEVRPV